MCVCTPVVCVCICVFVRDRFVCVISHVCTCTPVVRVCIRVFVRERFVCVCVKGRSGVVVWGAGGAKSLPSMCNITRVYVHACGAFVYVCL